MIFGHLLTSSNYNDEEEKVTGGRNGYGAKLCNIFSTMFTVETAAKEYKRSFKQVNISEIFHELGWDIEILITIHILVYCCLPDCIVSGVRSARFRWWRRSCLRECQVCSIGLVPNFVNPSMRWMFFLVKAEVQSEKCIIFPYLLMLSSVHNLHLT